MKDIQVNSDLIAYCGLYCAACSSYLKGKCNGCHENDKATWCKVRSCCIERGLKSCAECTDIPSPRACRKYNTFISRFFGLILNSDRAACIAQIKQLGHEQHAKTMTEIRSRTIKR